MPLGIWISSSIRSFLSGYMRQLPGTEGWKLIPGPLAPGSCYHSYHRKSSANPAGNACMRPALEISIMDYPRLGDSHPYNIVIEYDCDDGEIECDKAPSSANLESLDFKKNATDCSFRFEGGPGNSCTIGALEIYHPFKVEFKRFRSSVRVALLPGFLVKSLPAPEIYARFNWGCEAALQKRPQSGYHALKSSRLSQPNGVEDCSFLGAA